MTFAPSVTATIDWEKTGAWMAEDGMPLETTYSVNVKVKPMKASASVSKEKCPTKGRVLGGRSW